MQRIASAVWKGGPRAGEGTISSSTGVLEHVPFSFSTDSHNQACTSPCELLAAAHAAGVAIACSAELTRAGFIPQLIETEAVISMEQSGSNWKITASHINLSARVPDIDFEHFREIAERASDICPVSVMLGASMKVTVDVELEPAHVLVHG
jgi:osmotically inducible protein OsmC